MLVSSSSASGIKTCLYKGFLTAEGTKCSPERKEPESLHLPSTPALQRNNASQRSWQLALGRWQKQHCSLHKRRKRELSALGSSVIILPTISRKRRTTPSTNRAECLETRGCFSLQQFPLSLLLPQGWQIHSSRPRPLGSLFILSVFTHLLLMCLQ